MSTLYHPQCRFGSEGQKCLSVLRLWKDMKKEGCSCCWEIETLLYITTSGDLSALQLTTTATPTTIPMSVSVSLSLVFTLTLLRVLFPFCFTVTFHITPPFCIHTMHLSMFLSGWLYLHLYMCAHISLPDWICYIQTPSSILVCFGCQVVPVWYFRYVLAHLSVPIIPFLYLSASFICLSLLSVCSLAAAPAQYSPHGLSSPTVEITYPGQASIFRH